MTISRQKHLNQAFMRIPRRAESADRSTLAMTFVAAGSFSAVLHSMDHQILYGRRGTGKTHALFYLSDLVEHSGDVSVYLDLRTIGSAEGLYTDSNLSAAVRGTHLLVDTLEAIHEQLLSVAFEREVSDQNGLLVALDALAEAATAVEVVGEVERETKFGGSAETSIGVELMASPNAKLSATRRRSATAESRLRHTGIERAGGRPSKSFDVDQAVALLNAAVASRLYAYIVVSLLTGVRTEEARALTWDRVHLQPVNGLPAHVEVWRSVRGGGDTKTKVAADARAAPRGRRGTAGSPGPPAGGPAQGGPAVDRDRTGVHHNGGHEARRGQCPAAVPGRGSRRRNRRSLDSPRAAAQLRVAALGRRGTDRVDRETGRPCQHHGYGNGLPARTAAGAHGRR